MIELGFIALGVSVIGGGVQLLNYLNVRAVRKEASTERYAKADGVASELAVIRGDVVDCEDKLEDHSAKISALQSASAVLCSQMNAQIRELEHLSDKLDDLK